MVGQVILTVGILCAMLTFPLLYGLKEAKEPENFFLPYLFCGSLALVFVPLGTILLIWRL